MHLGMAHDTMLKVFVQRKAGIVLQRTLRHQIGIAHIRIVQVVEGRHAETLFHVGSHREEGTTEGIHIYKQRRRKF